MNVINVVVSLVIVYFLWMHLIVNPWKDAPRPQFVPTTNSVPSLIAMPGEEYYGYPNHLPERPQPRQRRGYHPQYR